jgi:WD40 repeat protein
LLKTISSHDFRIFRVRYSPNGKILAVSSPDRTFHFYQPDGTLLAKLNSHAKTIPGFSFSPDSQKLATASRDHTAKLWQLAVLETTPTSEDFCTLLTTFYGHQDALIDICFSPDGETLATSSHDRTVRLWQLEDLAQNSDRT